MNLYILNWEYKSFGLYADVYLFLFYGKEEKRAEKETWWGAKYWELREYL